MRIDSNMMVKNANDYKNDRSNSCDSFQSGSFFSLVSNCEILYNSLLEKDFLTVADFNEKVTFIKRSEIKIEYEYEDKMNTYIPQYIINFREEKEKKISSCLCGIINKNDFEKNWTEYRIIFKASKLFCIDNNLKFHYFTEKLINTAYLENIVFLNRYKKPQIFLNIEDIDILMYNISKIEISTPKNLIELCTKDNYKKAELLFTLWSLIASNLIKCDLKLPLKMDTEIYY